MTGVATSALGNYASFLYYLAAAGIIAVSFLWRKSARSKGRSILPTGEGFRHFLTFVELPRRKLRRLPRRVGPMPPIGYYDRGYGERRRISQTHPGTGGLNRLHNVRKT